MSSAARLMGSSSVSAALKVSSYAGLVHRLQLRPDHLLAFVPTRGVQDLLGLADVELEAGIRTSVTRRAVQEVGCGDALAAENELLDAPTVDQQGHGVAQRLVGESQVPALDARALAVDFLPGFGGVEHHMHVVAGPLHHDLAFAACFKPLQDLVLDNQIPGKVVFPRLQGGSRGAHRIATTLEFELVKEGLIGHVAAPMGFGANRVTRLEFDTAVGAGAHRLDVGRALARSGTGVFGKHMLGQDHAEVAGEGLGPEGRRLGEDHAHGVRIDVLDLDVAIDADGVSRACRICGVGPGKKHLVGREGLAVVPGHTTLELPDHARAIGRQAALGAAGNFSGQHRNKQAIAVPAGLRFIENARWRRIHRSPDTGLREARFRLRSCRH